MNDLLESLINSDIEENQEFGSLLLKSKDIPEEEREIYIKQLITKYLDNTYTINSVIMNNVIEAYSNLSYLFKFIF
jgi:hypothetical protein